jgi:ATP-dependent exoDNAse (exonuclease V) alpha subunit
MQVENDYDKDVYNGDLGVVSRIDMEEGEVVADFDSHEFLTASASSMNWCSLTRRQSTRAKARNTQLS